MKKRLLSTVLSMSMIAGMMVGVTAFAEEETEAPAAYAEEALGGKWGVAVPNATNSFYSTCVAGVEDTVAELDPDASVIVTDASFDSQKQLDQVADLVSQGVKALVLIPIDSNAILPAVEEAAEAGIPVLVMDTPCGETDGVVSTVIADNYNLGEIAGRALLEEIGGEGEIVTITTTGSEAVNNRKQALYDLIENEYPDIKITQEEIVQNGTTEEALTIMENILQGGSDVKGVFTTGDVFAIGICSALKANGYEPGEIAVTSIDGTTNAAELIESGYLLATAAQSPHALGENCVKNGLAYLSGEEVEELQALSCTEVNADNVADYVGF
ncbi:MAG: sugar ABC transporter substrate-binding protein [Lachnospiraceae bacterium]|nr:sugar ABC transporter substrate-binding protein [Lachnospiraceae bacterium]